MFIRLSTVNDIVATVPSLIGQWPHEQAIWLGLGHNTEHDPVIKVSAAVPLDSGDEQVTGTAIERALRRSKATEVIVVVYSFDVTAAADYLKQALTSITLPCEIAVIAGPDGWHSLDTGNLDAGLVAHGAYGRTPDAVAQAAAAGLPRPHATRAMLAEDFEPYPDLVDQLRPVLAQVSEELSVEDHAVEDLIARVDELSQQWNSGAPLSLTDVATLVVIVNARWMIRAMLGVRFTCETATNQRTLWRHVASHVDGRDAQGPLVLFALAAWLDADGPLPGIAMERYQRTEPPKSDLFTTWVSNIIREVPPHEWETTRAPFAAIFGD